MLRNAVLVSIMAFGAGSTAANAAIIEHSGNTDPTTEGWTLVGANPTINAGGTESGTDYWGLKGTPSSPGPASIAGYTYGLSGEDLTQGWAYEATIKPVFTSTQALGVAMFVRDGQDYWTLSVVNNPSVASGVGVYYLNGSGTWIRLSSDDPAGYHDYGMVYDASADGGSGAVTYTIDGVSAGTLTRDDVFDLNIATSVFWGVGTASGQEGRYSDVSFSLVPEPGSMAVLFGLGGLLFTRRRS